MRPPVDVTDRIFLTLVGAVGMTVGSLVGIRDGGAVGVLLGIIDGSLVGILEGIWEGSY